MSEAEVSRERREEIQGRLDRYPDSIHDIEAHDLRALLRDSAWRERVERDVRELADEMDYPADGPEIVVGTRYVVQQLRSIVDTGDEEET